MQARFMAEGHLSLPAPPAPEAFEIYLMQVDGDQWYAVPPPGWPAVLALGARLGVPWLVNPILAGACTLLAYSLVTSLYGRRTARLAVLLLCASPWHVYMGMNFMTHTLTLACTLAGAVAMLRARNGGGRAALWAGLAGASVGLAVAIRPLDGLIVGGLLGLWALGLGGPRLRLAALAAFGVGAALLAAALPAQNFLLTGEARRVPINVYADERFGRNANAYGFGPDRGMGWPIDPFPGHGPADALVNAALNTYQLNTELFGWGAGSLLLAGVALAHGRGLRQDAGPLAVIAAVFVAYFFYYFSGGPDFGARYWHLMLIPLVILTVHGLNALELKLAGTPAGGSRATAAVAILCGLALVNYFPWRALDKYHGYLGMRPGILALARENDFGAGLVLIQGEAFPDYAAAAVYNPLSFEAPVPIYAWDKDAATRDRVTAAFPDRPVWVVEGPSLTGGGYRVVGCTRNCASS
jgi:4-amino-4-deoxy-L-arabinose transferase-like glycosyltransferase